MLTLAMTLALAGCNGGAATFPSLAERPAERAFAQSGMSPPPPLQSPATPDAATIRQINALRSDATRAHEIFLQAVADATRLAAAAHGSEVGSEAWAVATVALATLDSARSQSALPLADLDALMVATAVTAAQANDAAGSATYGAVAEADHAVAALIRAEDERIAALHGTMSD
ncbi:hypothetical protein [Novosphingobium sp.]|uniref:hypothetical protein n=1 Tax=Novosphingobium sp. TaxID=1874826 RepID=UPI0033426CFA